VQIYDPVHEVKANETHREHDPRVLVDVTGRDAVHLVDVLVGVHDMLRGNGCDVVVISAAVDGVL